MVDNSTNINKMSNFFLRQNTKKSMTYCFGKSGVFLDGRQKVITDKIGDMYIFLRLVS